MVVALYPCHQSLLCTLFVIGALLPPAVDKVCFDLIHAIQKKNNGIL